MPKTQSVRIDDRTYRKLRKIGDGLLKKYGFKPTITGLIDILLAHYEGKKVKK